MPSGMSQMFESMIPDDVKAAIKEAREKLPVVIEAVKAKVDHIDAQQKEIKAQQKEINAKLDLLLSLMSDLRLAIDPLAVPAQTATAAAAFGLTMDLVETTEVKHGGSSGNGFDS